MCGIVGVGGRETAPRRAGAIVAGLAITTLDDARLRHDELRRGRRSSVEASVLEVPTLGSIAAVKRVVSRKCGYRAESGIAREAVGQIRSLRNDLVDGRRWLHRVTCLRRVA